MDDARPLLDRRTEYRPLSAQEYFIVTLLADRIHSALEGLPRRAGGRAVDIGCGEQPLRASLTALGYAYCGVDVQQNSAASVDVVAAIDQPLPAELKARAPFDLIVCTEVLEHVADWTTAFENLAALAAPGGHVLITCPHVWPLHEVPHDYWRPTPFALKFFASRVGLSVVSEEAAGDAFDVLGTVLGASEPLARTKGLVDRTVAAAANFARKAAFVIVRSPLFRRRVQVRNGFYLSNVVVLRRAPSA